MDGWIDMGRERESEREAHTHTLTQAQRQKRKTGSSELPCTSLAQHQIKEACSLLPITFMTRYDDY